VAPTWRKVLLGREKDERVNIFGFVPAAEKQRVRQLHATERTANAIEALVNAQRQPNPLVHSMPMHNYDGQAPWHQVPRSKGSLKLTDARWELRFAGTMKWIHGPMNRYSFAAVPTGSTSCHVQMADTQDPQIQWGFDLPNTSAEQLNLLVARHAGGTVSPSNIQALSAEPHAVLAIGIADELSKLVRLRDDGVLTEAEFAAQKARLLGSG
jgi:hypothetical protein